jgi:hypothetical protein
MRQNPYRMAYLLVLVSALLWLPGTAPLKAQQPAGPLFSPAQLDDLVAPIALYPDPLISQVLVAATYPLELVEAHQWLQRNPGLKGVALTQAVSIQDWDASVQGLVAFPDVVTYLTEDIAWTTNLGNAFLAQEADVMDAIQRMRTKAAQSGRLATSSQQQVTQVYDSGQPVYVIQPADPEVIYVPVYDPLYIWGPALYYPYANWYYPVHTSAIYYSSRVSLAYVYGPGWRNAGWVGWNDWGWRPAWGAKSVFVNNTFIGHQHFNSNPQIRTGTSRWSHDTAHRQGVPYSTPALNQRFRPNQQSSISNVRPSPVQQGGGGMPQAQRPGQLPMDRTLVDNRTGVRQTSPVVGRTGAQTAIGGSAANDFRNAGPNRINSAVDGGRNGGPLVDGGAGANVFRNAGNNRVNPATDVRRNGSQPDGTGAGNVFRNVGPNRTIPASVPTVTNRQPSSNPVQQPTRSFETGRRPNISNSPVTSAPSRATTMPQTNVQPSAPVRGSAPVSAAPQARNTPVSPPQVQTSVPSSGGGGRSGGGGGGNVGAGGGGGGGGGGRRR